MKMEHMSSSHGPIFLSKAAHEVSQSQIPSELISYFYKLALTRWRIKFSLNWLRIIQNHDS